MITGPQGSPPAHSQHPDDRTPLDEVLRRCSPETLAAARRFRQTGDPRDLPTIVRGVIARFVERELRPKLQQESDELRLVEDLGLDSLSLMEIVVMAEDVLNISVSNEELMRLRTVGDVQHFVAAKVGAG